MDTKKKKKKKKLHFQFQLLKPNAQFIHRILAYYNLNASQLLLNPEDRSLVTYVLCCIQ